MPGRKLASSVHSSIRGKILAITVFASAAALSVAAVGLATYEIISIRTTACKNMTVLSRVLGANCAAAVAFRDRSAAYDVLSAISREPGARSVAVYLADGGLLSAFPDSVRAADSWKPAGNMSNPTIRGRDIYFVEPVHLDHETIGYLRLHGYMHEMTPRLARYAFVMLIVVLVAVAAAVLLTNRLQRGITGPIVQLAGVVAHVSDRRDYAIRATRTTDDEVGLLVSGFNTMLAEIERRDGALQNAHDTLERRVQERTEELTRAKDAAEEAARAKTEFLANISHELRTPMHAILSFANFGINRIGTATPEKLLDYFTRINSSAGRLLGLLNDLLDLAKLDAGRMSMEPGSTDINALMTSVVDEFRSLLSEREIRVNLETTVARPFALDSRRILQVIRNVLGNAVKFSPAGGVISVHASTTERGLLVTVEDQGVGIPDEDLELVFGKFMQSRKTKTGAGGTGLGLAICREIVTAHHGRIWAEPGREVGAMICIEIPDNSTLDGRPSAADNMGSASCHQTSGRLAA